MPPSPGSIFVVSHPNDMPTWSAATDIKPTGVMAFEAMSLRRTLADWFSACVRQGYKQAAVTLEPWQPTPIGSTNAESATIQPEYSNEAIATGAWDDYLYSWARAARDSGLERIYVRFGHEMNGAQPQTGPDSIWYPHSHNPDAYVAAWKRVVSRFRNVKAVNVAFVWAPNSNMFMPAADFLKGALPYWPGTNWVDVVGLTGIQFGPPRTWMGTDLGYRLDVMRRVFGKPIAVAELNAAFEVRNDFFRTLAQWQRRGGGLEYIALSQHASRGAANGVTPHLMDWSVTTDTVGRNAFGDLCDAMRYPKEG